MFKSLAGKNWYFFVKTGAALVLISAGVWSLLKGQFDALSFVACLLGVLYLGFMYKELDETEYYQDQELDEKYSWTGLVVGTVKVFMVMYSLVYGVILLMPPFDPIGPFLILSGIVYGAATLVYAPEDQDMFDLP